MIPDFPLDRYHSLSMQVWYEAFREITTLRYECKRYNDNCTFGELPGVVAPPSKMQLASSSRLASQFAKGTLVAVPMENLG